MRTSAGKWERKYGMEVMTVVDVGKLKQKSMCCLHATDMEKSEEDGEG